MWSTTFSIDPLTVARMRTGTEKSVAAMVTTVC